MRGIVLAGGSGTLLHHPITLGLSKQMAPGYDKPMIYLPLSTLIVAGIRDARHLHTARRAVGRTAAGWPLAVRGLDQLRPAAGAHGLAQAFTIGADFIGDDTLALGDNIFHGPGPGTRQQRFRELDGAAVFAYWVADATAYGVIEFDNDHRALSNEEKPAAPRPKYAEPDLHFYDNQVVDIPRNSGSTDGQIDWSDDLPRHGSCAGCDDRAVNTDSTGWQLGSI